MVCALTESVHDRAMLCIAQSLVRVIVKSDFELLFFFLRAKTRSVLRRAEILGSYFLNIWV